MSEELELLRNWKAKGELAYDCRLAGIGWKEIKAICPDAAGLAGRWAKRNGRKWPLGKEDLEESLEDAGSVDAKERSRSLVLAKGKLEELLGYEIVDGEYLEEELNKRGWEVTKKEVRGLLNGQRR